MFRTTLGVAALSALALFGCGDCEGAAKDADAFVRDPANQHCETDADCVVVAQNCAPMKTTRCGQVSMSVTAAKSSKWAELMDGMDACDSICDTCFAELIAQCSDDGFCRKPE